MNEDKNLNKIRNLMSFNLNLSKYCDVGSLDRQSPDYILEKYNHWIGIEPVTDFSHYTPDNIIPFFNQYHRLWGDEIFGVKRQILYLVETESLKLTKMVNSFRNYFGPLELLSSENKHGLHPLTIKFREELLLRSKDLGVILRDMRLKQLLGNEI